MLASTIEAIIGAVYMDAGVNGLAAARAVIEHLGLNNHTLLMVTLRAAPTLALENNQMITNMPLYSSPTPGPPQPSMLPTPEPLTKRGPGTGSASSVQISTYTCRLGVQS